MSSFLKRLLSGIVLVIIIAATGILGGPVLFAFVLAISLIGLNEFLRVFKLEKDPIGIAGYVLAVVYYALIYLTKDASLGLFAVLGYLIVLMALYVFTFPKYKTEQVTAGLFGLVYVPVMLSFVYLLRESAIGEVDGKLLVFLVFICSWGCDTCAYCVGMLIGKHKMAPVLSPKKSVEGGIGGIVGAALLGLLYGSIFLQQGAACAILCAAGGAVSQVGDLAASAIKRNHDIKDYGHLIPGHGGILDRFDSVIITAPIIYALALLLMK